jgi:hypothetical protein
VQVLRLPFTKAPGPIPGSWVLMFTIPGGATQYLNVVPADGGTKLLLQVFSPTPNAQDGALSATCFQQ